MVLLAALAACGPDYSPNTYSTAAVQQANKVDQGVIAGYREVMIRADGTVGAIAGGAAGGVLGAQEPDGGVITALSTIGGTLVGGIIGTSVEHVTDDTKAFEYLVRKPNGDLLSVTQKDVNPLAIGLKVLVIEGKQARVVADYSVMQEPPPPLTRSSLKTEDSKKANEAKTDDTNKANGAPANAAPNAAPATTAATPTPAAIVPPPAAVQPPAAQAATSPAPAAPAPSSPADAQAAVPSSPAPQQSAPAPASPPAAANQNGSDQGGAGAAPSATPAPAPADTKAMP